MLVKKVHAAKGVIHQLIRSVTMSQNESILRSIIDQNPNSAIKSFISHLDSRLVKKTCKTECARYFGCHRFVKQRWAQELQVSQTSKTYKKMVKDRCLYTSICNRRIESVTKQQRIDYLYDCLN